jgi:nucleoside-diphosphate-sugar epimerase
MKILVTGSEGNIGKKLVPYLRKCGHEVMRLDIVQKYEENYIRHDIRDFLGWYGKAPDVVYHLAGCVSRITCEASRNLAVSTNILGTYNMVNFCLLYGAKLINFSTSEIYGNIEGLMSEDRDDISPNNIYGHTKLLAETLVEYEVPNGLKAVTVRPFMFYDEDETRGVHRSAMIRFAEALSKKQEIKVHMKSKRSWLHMDDAVEALERCVHLDKYDIINIGHPDVKPVSGIAAVMCNILKLDTADYVKGIELPEKMTLVKEPDLTKQKELLGFEPKISFEEGIERVIYAQAKYLSDEKW